MGETSRPKPRREPKRSGRARDETGAGNKIIEAPVGEAAPVAGSRGKTRTGAAFPAPSPLAELPRDYTKTLAEIKHRIHQERLRVVLAANSAMVLLYWDIGRMILERQERAGWGAKVIDRLSADLREAFADLKGFSSRNLRHMRTFAAAWPEREIGQQLAAQIPWYHNCLLLDRVPAPAARREREVEQALIDHLQRFLLELGSGFAFVGRQVHLELAGHDYYLDLLFYHLKLRCFVVIELKSVPFDPAFIGRINVYLSAVDDLLRHPDDKRTIGLLLCRSKDRIVVEYALRDLKKPIGVAGWETKIVESLPQDLEGSLPTVQELEAELSREESGGAMAEIPAGARRGPGADGEI
jgi:predicted nuclease of restriction endonuclease-like (RecB) superfamily